MDDRAELIGLVENPSARRVWLLASALRSLPLDRAIELARAAEGFVTGSLPNTQTDTPVNPDPKPIQSETKSATAPDNTSATDPKNASATAMVSSAPQRVEQKAHKHSAISLQGADRDRLLGRLAAGAKNRELAAEFGVSPKQVQGVRMGCGREIARRREQLSGNTELAAETAVPTASVEEVVRYLRQQDDVVVPQQNGGFLVNGRFQMPLAELVSRANRMRARQGKPVFELLGSTPVPPASISSGNGHPLFWEKPAPTGRGGNGFHQTGKVES